MSHLSGISYYDSLPLGIWANSDGGTSVGSQSCSEKGRIPAKVGFLWMESFILFCYELNGYVINEYLGNRYELDLGICFFLDNG